MRTRIAVEGDTFETIALAEFGRQDDAIMNLLIHAGDNSRLCHQGIFLQPGCIVSLPEVAAAPPVPERRRAQELWD